MAQLPPSNTSVITKQIEKNLQTQNVRKMQKALELEKKNITQDLNRKSKGDDWQNELKGQVDQFEINLKQFNISVSNLDEDTQKEFNHALKILGSFQERTAKKLSEISLAKTSAEKTKGAEEEKPARVSTRRKSKAFSKEIPPEEMSNIFDTNTERQAALFDTAQAEPGLSSEAEELTRRNAKSYRRISKKTPAKEKPFDTNIAETDVAIEPSKPKIFTQHILEQIKSEEDKVQQKELAIGGILQLYALQPPDESIINQSLQSLLPYAYPHHFSLEENNKLHLIGKELPKLRRAFGLTTSENSFDLDVSRFNWTELEDLRLAFSKEKGLWSILKSFKPIDEHFTLKLKVDACVEVLKEISDKKLIKTGKLNSALLVLNYAGSVAKEGDDSKQLARLKSYFSKPKNTDSEETKTLSAWIQRKIKSSKTKISFPKALTDFWNNRSSSLSEERKAIESWFHHARTLIPNDQKNMIELVHQMREFYFIEHDLVSSMTELKEIMHSRLNDFEKKEFDVEFQQLTEYVEKIERFISTYEAFRLKFPIRKDDPIQEVISNFPNLLHSQEFNDYLSSKEALAKFEEIEQLNSKFNFFLNSRNVFDPSINEDTPLEVRLNSESYIKMEERTHSSFSDYASKPSLAIPKLDIHLTNIVENIKAINKIANQTLPFSKENVDAINSALELIKKFGGKANLRQVENNAIKDAQNSLQKELGKQVRTEKQAALKSILQLYTSAALKGSYSEIYLAHYLEILLPIACPEHFQGENGRLKLKGDRNVRAIFKALGQNLSLENNDISLVPSLFNANALNHLKTLYPESTGLWSMLKTLKPIDSGFTAMDKINACLEVVYEISQKNIISSEKFKYALEILSFAYDEAKEYRIALKDKKQSWLSMNVIEVEFKENALSYQVKDSAYQIQTGEILLDEMGLTNDELQSLKGLQGESPELINKALPRYLSKILPILIERGHAYEKGDALKNILKTFNALDASSTLELNEDTKLVSLRDWLRKELVTKKQPIPNSSQAKLNESDIKFSIEKEKTESPSRLFLFLQYITAQFRKWINYFYDKVAKEERNISVKTREQPTDELVEELEEQEPMEMELELNDVNADEEEITSSHKFVLDRLKGERAKTQTFFKKAGISNGNIEDEQEHTVNHQKNGPSSR